jgi:prepilin-type N-terminal cleavage/methylation domain-containing protein
MQLATDEQLARATSWGPPLLVARGALRRSRARAGFTLVEVLLTLLIMSGIMVALTQILTAARTSRDTIHNIQETQLAGPAILDLLERDLRGIVTYDRTRQVHLRVKNRVMLGMDADSIDFVTSSDSLTLANIDDRFVKADINEVGYRLRPNPGATDQFLEIYRREGFGVDDDPFENGTFMFLHDRVKSFDIHCFAKDGRDEQPIDEWGGDQNPENIGLPARIEIALVLELAPRVVNEQLLILPNDRRTLTYKRVIRFPQSLRGKEEDIAVPRIPTAPAGTTPQPGSGSKPTGGATPPTGSSSTSHTMQSVGAGADRPK